MSYDNKILNLCFCIIEFIKLIAKKRYNAWQAWHFIFFPQLVLIKSIKHEHSCKIFYLYIIMCSLDPLQETIGLTIYLLGAQVTCVNLYMLGNFAC